MQDTLDSNTIADTANWDLSDLYQGLEDPQIKTDV
ncbi:MAG: M3 family oligoendopeptidase, partial [Candidatus Dadabacteria bacterium]|nr:M3 family oligoendopeptidase [Candidatus Dadabacteria bacterium]NIS09491.1 M3 family oligoendopeptidase [Candidatus Dadabacteria bacterium]